MIVLGIDPALRNVGWAVILQEAGKLKYLSSGVINTDSSQMVHKRLAYITTCLEKTILDYKPNIIALEETFVNMNNASSLKLGYARGAIMALVGKYDINFQEFKPNTIKKTVTGYGHAEKSQILHMIKLLLPSTSQIKNADEADAIAIAYTSIVTKV